MHPAFTTTPGNRACPASITTQQPLDAAAGGGRSAPRSATDSRADRPVVSTPTVQRSTGFRTHEGTGEGRYRPGTASEGKKTADVRFRFSGPKTPPGCHDPQSPHSPPFQSGERPMSDEWHLGLQRCDPVHRSSGCLGQPGAATGAVE